MSEELGRQIVYGSLAYHRPKEMREGDVPCLPILEQPFLQEVMDRHRCVCVWSAQSGGLMVTPGLIVVTQGINIGGR